MVEIVTMKTLFGGNLIAQMFSILLYGVLIAQCYSYFLNRIFKHDHFLLKFLVSAVWFLETLHTVCVMHYVYQTTILDFSDLIEVIAHTPWSASLSFIVNMLVVGLVQGYYIRRIWILSKRSYLVGIMVLVIILILRVGCGIATAVMAFKLHNYVVFHDSMGPRVTVICGLTFAAIMDSAITAIMMYLLWRQKTGFTSSDEIIRLLMAYVANTGVLAMIVSVVTLISYMLMKNSTLYVGLALVTAKLYSNSFLGTLNARDPLRTKASVDVFDSAELSAIRAANSLRLAGARVELELNQGSKPIISTKSTPYISFHEG